MTEAVERALKQRVKGAVRFDEVSRVIYSTDASLYQVMPLGVVIPRDEDDVIATVRTCAELRVPILPRGAGTSLGGQTVGCAVVIDFTPDMNSLVELNAADRWVRVQPGLVLDNLNAALKAHWLHFVPDVATSNRASIGGMIGNNSSGAHSLVYGKTVDHVKALEVVLSDGQQRSLNGDSGHDHRAAELTKRVERIAAAQRDEILARFPKLLRRVAGYNLERFLSADDQAQFTQPRNWRDSTEPNLAKIVVGSEGTLCTILEAKLNLMPLPKHTGLCVAHFHDLIAALEAVPAILECEPSAVELTDSFIIDLCRGNLNLAPTCSWIHGEPAAVLMIEFDGDTDDEVRGRVTDLKQRLHDQAYAFHDAFDPTDRARAYGVRKSGLGLLMGLKGEAKPQGFIEDTAVAPEHLADYIRRLRTLLKTHGCEATYYAHASVGCLHVRPVLSVKSPEGIARMRQICEETCALVLEYGGSFSSEHGDGLVRSEFIERSYGRQLCEAFRQVKQTFDPLGIMNPGKIVDPLRMDENLRVQMVASGREARPATFFDWSRDGGLLGHLELCSGVGACRKTLEGTMCPSYRATRDEKDTTRARANMFRAVMTGVVAADGLASDELHEVLDLCLECKACKSECPSNVDMAKLKYEFLAHYHERNGRPLRARLMAQIARANYVGSLLPAFTNRLMASRWQRQLLARLGIAAQRPLPRLARQTFADWFKLERRAGRLRAQGTRVLLLNDTFTNYNEPQLGVAAVRVLESLGHVVELTSFGCCGRPLISKGFLREARQRAGSAVQWLAHELHSAEAVVGLEPSCVSALKDDYLDLVGGTDVELVAKRTMMIEEFLVSFLRAPERDRSSILDPRSSILFHGHCHQKALFGTAATLECLRLVGYDVREIPSGCCGMAGSFGYEREHYDLSMQIGEQVLFPAVRNAEAGVEIVAEGTSCRHQIEHGTGRRARHPVELLAAALAPGNGDSSCH